MEIRIIAPLPKITISGNEIVLDNARITKLPFEEILALENKQRSGVYNKLHFRYKNHPPVFFEKWITVEDEPFEDDFFRISRSINRYAKSFIDVCFVALHFATKRALLHPSVSIIYYDYRNEKNLTKYPQLEEQFKNIGAYRIMGESGREYAVQNKLAEVFINEDRYQEIKDWYQFIEARKSLINKEMVQFLLEPIQSLALPGMNEDTRQILLTGTLESLLAADIKSGINKHFVKRFRALCSKFPNFEEEIIQNTYKLRNAIIHGDSQEEKEKILKKTGLSYQKYLAKLQDYALMGMIEFLKFANSNEPINAQLSEFRKQLD